MNKLLLRIVGVTLFISVVIAAYVLLKEPCFAGTCPNQQASEKHASEQISTVSSTEFKRRLLVATNARILDVRTQEEFLSGHLENALNSDIYDPSFRENISELDKTAEWFVYCRSGNRSKQAVSLMKELGFTKITELQGGILSWEGELVQ